MFVPPSAGTGVAPTPRLLERLLPCAWVGAQPSQGLRPALRPWTHHADRPLALRADAPGALPAPVVPCALQSAWEGPWGVGVIQELVTIPDPRILASSRPARGAPHIHRKTPRLTPTRHPSDSRGLSGVGGAGQTLSLGRREDSPPRCWGQPRRRIPPSPAFWDASGQNPPAWSPASTLPHPAPPRPPPPGLAGQPPSDGVSQEPKEFPTLWPHSQC